jgi:hypothetical protein
VSDEGEREANRGRSGGFRRTSRGRTALQREPYNRLRHLRHSPFG